MDHLKTPNAHPTVLTFGCRLNTYESEVILEKANEAHVKSNVVFVNTCAVTQEAERQARQAIRKHKRLNPDAQIIVTGCSAQISPHTYSAMPEVSAVWGNEEKLKSETYQSFSSGGAPKVAHTDIMHSQTAIAPFVEKIQKRTRAHLQIQNGCDHRCTFCTIPYGRGNSRSVTPEHIFRQVQAYLNAGYQELVLTGVDITSYGHDLPHTPTLGQLIKRLLKAFPQLPRLRLSSVDPVEIDEDVFDVLSSESRFMPHLHISLQAGDDLILKRMKRRHLRKDLLTFCQKARKARPDVLFGADIIAGFPTETEAHFQNTFNIIQECDLTHVHVFPYSPRPGTPAARMPQVAKPLIKERARLLREEADRNFLKHLKLTVGKTEAVLFEANGYGHTPGFLPVLIDQNNSLTGQIHHVKIDGYKDNKLLVKELEDKV